MFFDRLRQGQMYIAIFAGKDIRRYFVNFFYNKGLYQQAISINKNQGVFCLCEQGIPELTDPVSGDLRDDGIPFLYINGLFDFYFLGTLCTQPDIGGALYLGGAFIVTRLSKKDALMISFRQDGIGIDIIFV